MEKRRSTRVRHSRYIEKDGFRILKLNNYSLESGERSVLDVEMEGTSSTLAQIPPVKSAWSLFLSDFHAGKLRKYATPGAGPSSLQTSQQRASILWNTTFGPNTSHREEYEKASRELQRLNQEARERAIQETKIRIERKNQLQLELQIQEEARRVEIMAKEKERRMKSEKRRAERKAREAAGELDLSDIQNSNPHEIFRRKHNNMMKKRKSSQEKYRMEFFAKRKNILEGFVDPKVLSSLPSKKKMMSTKTMTTDNSGGEFAEHHEIEIDTEGAPLVEQPPQIVNGMFREEI